MNYPNIGDYAMLSDCHGAALVCRDAVIEWCCFHRFDARPVFARILDRDRGGWWRVGPEGESTSTRRYIDGTNVLETTFTTPGGVVTVTDALVLSGPLDPPERHPDHLLVRRIRGIRGEVRMRMDFVPVFDFGVTLPRVELIDQHHALVYGGADGLALMSEMPLEQTDPCSAIAYGTVGENDDVVVACSYDAPHDLHEEWPRSNASRRMLDETIARWQEWSDQCRFSGEHRDEVVRSALVLKGLTNAPTGAIVAAATTSLPECVGGVRNWDYRYAWLRDAALNVFALFNLGYKTEARAFIEWLRITSAGRASDLQPLYGVGGERLLPEVELTWLEGWRGSQPVRIGNAATGQVQHDVWGELLDTAWLHHSNGGEIGPVFWEFLENVIVEVNDHWDEPDEGIWEPRDGKRHYVSSKIFCWVAVDRAIRIAADRDPDRDTSGWEKLRDRIHESVMAEGINPVTGAFRRSYDDDSADAANLLAPLVGFVDSSHPVVRATVEGVKRELSDGPLVKRYVAPDGLPGEEGSFVICSFWLVDNLALLGEVAEAESLFNQLCAMTNDVGLLAEQIDPATHEMLGNFPQAFSHVGLIGAAINIAKARAAS